MPANRNALIRYKTIDMCLQNRYKKWTLEDLIEACSDALHEYEGIGKGVSRRTVQLDLQLMRSDKLGYNAPIVVIDKKYYTYEDPDYSIMNIPVSESDLEQLLETVEFLKQFKGFSYFKELNTIVQKLEDHVYANKIKRKPVIYFEKNDNLKGIENLDILYQAIINKRILEITYQSFNARQAGTFNFFPYMLKEFRNRWFLIGSKTNDEIILNLAIDRIQNIKVTEKIFSEAINFDPEEYFKNVIGVTVNPGMRAEKVSLFVTRKHAPYVLTKPFHASQNLIEQNEHGIIVEFEVQHNYELEKEILGFGDGITVLAPEQLKDSIKLRFDNAIKNYNTATDEAKETLQDIEVIPEIPTEIPEKAVEEVIPAIVEIQEEEVTPANTTIETQEEIISVSPNGVQETAKATNEVQEVVKTTLEEEVLPQEEEIKPKKQKKPPKPEPPVDQQLSLF